MFRCRGMYVTLPLPQSESESESQSDQEPEWLQVSINASLNAARATRYNCGPISRSAYYIKFTHHRGGQAGSLMSMVGQLDSWQHPASDCHPTCRLICCLSICLSISLTVCLPVATCIMFINAQIFTMRCPFNDAF